MYLCVCGWVHFFFFPLSLSQSLRLSFVDTFVHNLFGIDRSEYNHPPLPASQSIVLVNIFFSECSILCEFDSVRASFSLLVSIQCARNFYGKNFKHFDLNLYKFEILCLLFFFWLSFFPFYFLLFCSAPPRMITHLR